MTIREAIHALEKAGRIIGFTSDVVFVSEGEFVNISGIIATDKIGCPEHLKWCFSDPVAVIETEA